jgi:hypothetical protein
VVKPSTQQELNDPLKTEKSEVSKKSKQDYKFRRAVEMIKNEK